MISIIVPVREGKMVLSPVQSKLIKQEYERCEGGEVRLTMKKDQRDRTLRQNRYYWGAVLATIASDDSEIGHSPEELHYIFKHMFLPKRFTQMGNAEVLLKPTTTVLNTKEFTEYVDKIVLFAAEQLNIRVPLPSEM